MAIKVGVDMKVAHKKDMLMSALGRDGGPDLATVVEYLNGCHREAREDLSCPPCAYAQQSYVGRREALGINSHYFWKINDSAEKEPALYWKCLEALRPLARELLWLLVSPQSQRRDTSLLSKLVNALPSCRSRDGTRIVRRMGFLLIDVVIREFIRSEEWVCKALEMFLSQCHSDDRQIYLLSMLDTVMCCAEGVIEDCKEERECRRDYKQKLNNVSRYLENKFSEMITKLEESVYKDYFGIGDEDVPFQAMVLVGKLPDGMRYYSRALLIKNLYSLPISTQLSKMLVGWALAFDDAAHFWKSRDYRVVSLAVANCLCGMKDFPSCWKEYVENFAQMLYVGLHAYGLKEQHRYDERMGMYLESAVAIVDHLCLEKKFEIALMVWRDAWNVCVPALYGWVFSDASVNMIQCLYTYRMKYMPGSSPEETSTALLEQLPVMVMRNGNMINVHDACKQTLLRNQ